MGLTIGITASEAYSMSKGMASDAETLHCIESAVRSAAGTGRASTRVYCDNRLTLEGEKVLRNAGFTFEWIAIDNWTPSGYYEISWNIE